MKKYQKGFTVSLIIAIIAIVIIGGGAYYYVSNDPRTSTTIPTQDSSSQAIPTNPSNTIIPAAPVSPSITILSPNGGETLEQNLAYSISWSYTGLSKGDLITIALRSTSESPCWIGTVEVSRGSYNFTPSQVVCKGDIPGSVPNLKNGGQYKAQVIVEKYADGRGVADTSDNYFTIATTQTGSQAKSMLENIRNNLGPNSRVEAWTGYNNISGYKLSVTPTQKDFAHSILAMKIQEVTNPYNFGDRVEHAYENWHVLCMIVGLGSGSSQSDLSYVWCGDKTGVQKVDVVVKNIKNIDASNRTFMLMIGEENMKIKMPSVVQNTNYANGTFADFVKAVTSSQYQSSTFQMTGEIKGDAFEVTSIQWILG